MPSHKIRAVEGTVAAAKPREPTRQEPASEEVPKRPRDKLRHTLAVAQPGRLDQERLEVILHNLVKHPAGRATRFVRDHPGRRPADEGSGPQGLQPEFNETKRIYVYGASGDVAALDRASGKPVWTVNVLQRTIGISAIQAT